MSSELPKPEAPKDRVIFLTEDEASEPSKVILQENDENPPGLILSNGDINWNCPCLGGMAVGPCGVDFRDAFSCFHYSEADPKGSDCIEKFAEMQKCMQGYPELFEEKERKQDDTGDAPEEITEESAATEEPADAEKSTPSEPQ
eukprot:TRINITY_DN66955_c0_g1_i1.p1 TRINITY_DN66955_c0_g1~~TRINITY_DN66955_c0_g1_i1.p1  ORF type:complete len:144 (-),score=44.95 TRINITY_DN66955_c0_g1_i1:143-574(-)